MAGSWTASSIRYLASQVVKWFPDDYAQVARDFDCSACAHTMQRDLRKRALLMLMQEAEHHPGLALYFPVAGAMREPLSMNPTLHNKAVPAKVARLFSRLMCGGQGLRGGDPRIVPDVTVNNCCIACLHQGRREVETLMHFPFTCPSYAAIRQCSVLMGALRKEDSKQLRHHRNYWR